MELQNTSFTAAERRAISRPDRRDQAQARHAPELTAEQISGVEQKLDDLVEASKRVGRKDWLTMLYGAAFGMIVNDRVPAHIVQAVIAMTIHGPWPSFRTRQSAVRPPTCALIELRRPGGMCPGNKEA